MKKLMVAAVFISMGFACITSCTKQVNSPLIGVWRRVVSVDTIHIVVYDTVYLKITDNVNMEYGYTEKYGYVGQASGTYTYTPSQFTFTVQVNDTLNNCLGYAATYKYAVSNGGNQLTTSVISDTCTESGTGIRQRSNLFSGVWMSQ